MTVPKNFKPWCKFCPWCCPHISVLLRPTGTNDVKKPYMFGGQNLTLCCHFFILTVCLRIFLKADPIMQKKYYATVATENVQLRIRFKLIQELITIY